MIARQKAATKRELSNPAITNGKASVRVNASQTINRMKIPSIMVTSSSRFLECAASKDDQAMLLSFLDRHPNVVEVGVTGLGQALLAD